MPEPTPPPNPDLLLARRAAAADPAAWNTLIDRYGQRIYHLALRFTNDPTEAEDLTQDIFLKLYRRLHRYRGDVPLIGWTLRLSRNLCIDHYRAVRARPLADTVSDAVLAQLPAADDPRRRAQAREQLRAVHRALAAMREELATAVALRELHQMTYDEIATFLDVPLGTVKSRINRGRRELMDRLDAELRPAADATAGEDDAREATR